MKKRFSILISITLILSILLSSLCISSSALISETPAGYTKASDVVYKFGTKTNETNFIYNWGVRGEDCVFISSYGQAYYTGSNTYDNFENMSVTALKSALKTLMKTGHKTTSYNNCRDYAIYTDCQKNDGTIVLFYTGYVASTGDYAGGGSVGWNREHVWPQSLGGDNTSGGGADLLHIRPDDYTTNNTRGSKKFDEINGGTAVNGGSLVGGMLGGYSSGNFFEPLDEVKGDVARIILYMWIRWDTEWNTSNLSVVFPDTDVLLQWCEEDPVDTWEMGRNDAAQSIQGNRNVFVDYPELAWLVLGEDVPADLQTPSGGVSSDCGHNNFDSGVTVNATCTTDGYVLFTCKTSGCGYSYKANIVSAKGHSYTAGTCTVCGEAEPAKPVYITSPQAGVAYKLGFLNGSERYFTGSMSTANKYYGATDTDFSKGVDIFVESVSGGYRLYFKNGNQKNYINLVVSGIHRNFTFSTTAISVFTWDTASNAFKTELEGEYYYMGNYGSYTNMGTLNASEIDADDYIARLYVMSDSGNVGGNTGSGDSGNTGGNTGSGDSGNTGGNTGSGDSGNTGGNTGSGDSGNTGDNTGSGDSGNTGDNTGSGDSGNTNPTPTPTPTPPTCEHVFSQWYVKVAATETTDGIRARICIYCTHEETVLIDINGTTVQPGCEGEHTFSAWYTKVAPTATESGVSERICIYCGRTQTKQIAPTGTPTTPPTCTEHSYGEWVTVTEPTESEYGTKKHTCTSCGHEETAQIDKLTPTVPEPPKNETVTIYTAPETVATVISLIFYLVLATIEKMFGK